MIRGSVDRVRVKVQRLPHAEGLSLPAYQSAEAAGLDLVAAIPAGKALRIAPRKRVEIPTGLCLHLPLGLEGQVRPRSGLATRHGLTIINAPGTIDSDYRGEVKVWLVNLGEAAVDIHRGDRIAQLVIARVSRATLIEVERLERSARGRGGFGSTGLADEQAVAVPASSRKRAKAGAAMPVARKARRAPARRS